MLERRRRKYMGYTIGQSLFSSRWVIRRGCAHIASAPSAFDAVELVDGIIDAVETERLLRGDPHAVASRSEARPGRNEAINGKNPSPATLAENLARASLAGTRDLAELRGPRSAGDFAPKPPDGIRLDHKNDTEGPADANASLSPDVDAFLKSPAIAALRQEERVLSLKLAEQVADDPEVYRRAAGAIGKIEAADSRSGSSLRDDERSPPLWDSLKGIQNTHDILVQKGKIICKIVMMALEDGEFVSSTLLTKNSLVRSTSKQEYLTSRAETAAFLLYIVDKFLIKSLIVNERAVLMPVVEDHIKQELTTIGYDRVKLSKLFEERYAEYVKYERWSIEINQEGRPLFWDFSERISNILGNGQNYLFNLLLTTMLLKKIDDWALPRLLRGE